jgi:hypothetical protein
MHSSTIATGRAASRRPEKSVGAVSAIANWRELPLLQVRAASQILGLSTASVYGLAHAGRLKLKRLAGRTLVETKSLVEVIDSATDWTPSPRGAAAVAKRSARARQSWSGET